MSDPKRWLEPESGANESARDLLRRAPAPPAMSADAKARIAARIGAESAAPVIAARTARWKLLFGSGVIGLASLALFWRSGHRTDVSLPPPARVEAPIAQPAPRAPEPTASPIELLPRGDTASAPSAAPAGLAADNALPAPITSGTRAHETRTSLTAPSAPRASSGALHAAHAEPARSPDELEIVQRASALVDRDPRSALTVTREHEQQFPHGDYVEERESIAVRALANSGQTRAARDRAERFLRQYPSSIYATRVRGILDSLR